jgi:hypothetical protein
MPKGSSKEQLTKNKKPKAIKGFGITVPLPATSKKKKKSSGPVGGPKPKKKKKGIADLLKGKGSQAVPATPYNTFKKKKKPKLEEPKLLPERKVPAGEKPNMLDVAGGAKTVNVKGGGLMEATKRLKAQGLKKGGFPDLSGDGKITMKDILMGRGVVKKPKKKAKGGAVDTPRKKRGNYGPNIGKPFKAMGPVGGVPVNKSGTKIMSKGLAAGVAGAMKAGAKAMKKAGRLALRGYGKARK